MTGLPTDGETNWGDILNNYIQNTVYAAAQGAQTSINNHAGNIPADPHGDRSYALSLISPLTAGVNLPNGFVQLNGLGKIPVGLVPGAVSNVFDVVLAYGATGNGSTDDSTACQNALNAATAAGGGVVYFPPGYTFAIGSYLYVGSNTTVFIGGKVSRITGLSTPSYMFTDCQFGTSNAPGSKNVTFCGGGTIDTFGPSSLTTACTGIFLMNPVQNRIKDLNFNAGKNAPAIELDGALNCVIDSCFFNGVYGSSGSIPAIRINSSQTATSPSGLAGTYYTNSGSVGVSVIGCGDGTSGQEWAYAAATDLYSGVQSTYLAFGGNIFGANVNTANWGSYAASSGSNV